MKSFNKESKAFAKQNRQVIEKAAHLGAAGYKNGKKAPCLCSDCMKLVEEYQNIPGAALAILSAWCNAFQAAHLIQWKQSIEELKNKS